MAHLTLSRQLLLLQMLLVLLVVGAVSWVSAIQADTGFRERESRRMLASAESMASEGIVRGGLVQLGLRGAMGERMERSASFADASYMLVVDTELTVLAAKVPLTGEELGPLRGTVGSGGSWSGQTERFGRKAIEAQVAVLSDGTYSEGPGKVLGYVILGSYYPSRLEVIRSAAPTGLFYLAIGGALGVAGSLLIARRVKRQTLGLEPGEITALVEQREAMLHGVREGVIGVDHAGRVSFANDEALELLALPADVLGQPVAPVVAEDDVRRVLEGEVAASDLVLAVRGRLLVLNTQRLSVRGARGGWVTSMRDKTELLGLEQELADAHAGTQTLRAQVHEFRNRLHVVAGLAELDSAGRVQEFVRTVLSGLEGRVDALSATVEDPAVAALLVAKASRADELGVRFQLADGSFLPEQDPALSADLVTVIGNLVDNAFDAVPSGGGVELELSEEEGHVVVEVSDTGSGFSEEALQRAFDVGWTTKGGEARSRGYGLALTRMACQRHGGSVSVVPGERARLRAELRVGPRESAEAEA